jgi:hypothetical protein
MASLFGEEKDPEPQVIYLDAPSDDPAPVLSGLERLVVLRSAGALNDDEFERAKAQVLATGA